MLLASRSCSGTSNAPNQRPEPPISSPIPKVVGVSELNTNHTLPQTQTQNPTISIAAHIGAPSRSSSSVTDDVAGAKNVGPLPSALSLHEPSKATNTSTSVLPRGILLLFD